MGRSGDQEAQPDAKLPSQAIARGAPLRRIWHDLQLYLLSVRRQPGLEGQGRRAPSVEWPTGIGAKGNEGVANNVAQTKGSIGYVEYAYALQNKLTYTQMINKDGKTVAPTSEAFAAAAGADWKSKPGFGVILANQPGAASWPMTAGTWILMYKQPKDSAASAEALKFFDWAYKNGDKMAEELDYIPMPDSVVADVENMWAADIKDSAGKPVFAMN